MGRWAYCSLWILISFLFEECFCGNFNLSTARMSNSSDFRFGNERMKVVFYRIIGNDKPPLQHTMQSYWNLNFTLRHETNFPDVQKRWILNRVWNETTFVQIYTLLIRAGVHRRDILTQCFDKKKYDGLKSYEDKFLYLTAQNEGRNLGLSDGRASGFEWTLVLDGNTFITDESWKRLSGALLKASKNDKKYVKIPYHRLNEPQDGSWLNSDTSTSSLFPYAPLKGESQIAFYKSSKEFFSLTDTSGKKREYNHQDKAHLFAPGAVCGPTSSQCECADVVEANRDEIESKRAIAFQAYAQECGLVLRLWNHPISSLITTGMSSKEEEGFYYFLDQTRSSSHHDTECELFTKAISKWKSMSEKDQKEYHKSNAIDFLIKYKSMHFSEPCFLNLAREHAMDHISDDVDSAKSSEISHTCSTLRPPPDDLKRKHYMTTFDINTLQKEKEGWEKKSGLFYESINPMLKDLVSKADRSLKLGPYSVTYKERHPADTSDKKFYYSVRPYFWRISDLPKDMQSALKAGKLPLEDGKGLYIDEKGLLHRDGVRAPGTVIGGDHENFYDRASAWYVVDNVTTLALAWFFTDEDKYAKYAVKLVDTFFLDSKTGMYPSLDYAQDGERTGLIDWKDFYYLLDAFTLLEMSGQLESKQVASLRQWCAKLAHWYMKSIAGWEEGNSNNNHALYFDLSTASLAVYSGDDDMLDLARSRLYYRLSRPAPQGHFALNGSQPHEVTRPTALHYVTFNLIGWIHVAQVVEAAREHSEVPGSFQSLWAVKHISEQDDPHALPVLCKAIRWLAQFLPKDINSYKDWTEPTPGMGVNFPYKQVDEFAFSRLLEVVHYGVLVYDVKGIFPEYPKLSTVAKSALSFPLYTSHLAMYDKYSSVDPDAGTRAWTALGLYYTREVTGD